MDSTQNNQQASELAKIWELLSEHVVHARHTPNSSDANDALRYQLQADVDGAMSPALLLWIGDNFFRDARFKEAIETYTQLVEKYSTRTFIDGRPLAVDALEQICTCYERLGNPEAAFGALKQLFTFDPKVVSQAWINYHTGQIAEEAGRLNDASNFYERAAVSTNEASHMEAPVPELARRAALRLKLPGKSFVNRERLAMVIAGALEKQDFDSLTSLASPTHFTLGIAGSEMEFVDWQKILPLVKEDLVQSKVRIEPAALHSTGRKTYLPTLEWKGKLLTGRVLFILTESGNGWQWAGLALTQPGEGWKKLFPPPIPEKNQPLSISIRAPWKAGDCYRAGGLDRYLLSHVPFAGIPIFFSDNFGPCGYGPGGFHYNASGHSGTDAFAIDFTRYVTALPYVDAANNQPILAVKSGLITFSRGTFRSGDPTDDNRIEMDLMDFPELIILILSLLGGLPVPRSKYHSKSLHLAGPTALMSRGLFIRQGTRVGLMDDTGLSALPHLHFSIHDRDMGDRSVRPTPMDGQTLNDWEGGKCICSTNVPFP